jgi:multidrug efflux pump subunit AcrB
MAREMTPRVSGLSGVTAFPVTPPSLGQGFIQRPINFVIITSDSYQNLSQTVRAFQDELAKNPGFVQVDTDLRLNKPEIKELFMNAGVEVVASTADEFSTVIKSEMSRLGKVIKEAGIRE